MDGVQLRTACDVAPTALRRSGRNAQRERSAHRYCGNRAVAGSIRPAPIVWGSKRREGLTGGGSLLGDLPEVSAARLCDGGGTLGDTLRVRDFGPCAHPRVYGVR